MDIVQALKSGIIPATANPVEIILVAHKEGLKELLDNQITRHRLAMKQGANVEETRRKFKVTCDFTETDMMSMTEDLKSWTTCDDTEDLIFHFGDSDVEESHYRSSIIGNLRRKKLYKPLDDNASNNCYNCKCSFDSYMRWIKTGKHHCRACGRIFCGECTKNKEVIPNDLVEYVSTKGWIVEGKPSRVCQACKEIINNFRKIQPILEYFEIVAYPIDLCIKASTLCKDWREAMRFYLSNVRDIQYTLPSVTLSERDISALKSNSKLFQGHSKWMIQLLKMGMVKTNLKRTKKCRDIMCDTDCLETLSPFDAVIILNSPVYNVEVRFLALQILESDRLQRRSYTNEEILGPIMLDDLLANKSSFSRDVALFLPCEDTSVQEFIIKCPDLFLDFFWLSRINNEYSSDIFRNKLLLANQSEAKCVQESLRLVSMLNQYSSDLCQLSNQLQTLKVPFAGPFGMINKFDHELTVKTSVTKPIIVRYFSGSEKRAFLYKKEDIRKDAHIVALIRIMHYLCSDIFSNIKTNSCKTRSSPVDIKSASEDVQLWFTRSSPISLCSPINTFSLESPDFICNLPDPIFTDFSNLNESFPKSPCSSGLLSTYRVVPVSIDAGFIEIVSNASTLYDILSQGDISDYLYRPDEGGDVKVIGSNYCNSLAFWTVATFLLGVGDRHQENIMIRRDGVLFHIDYGFVFGSDSTSSVIRLDKNLIKGLGGPRMYEPFKILCCEIFSCLRHHFNLIYSCLLRLSSIQPPITGYKFTQSFIHDFVVDRFLIGQTDEEAKITFSNIIDSNRETLMNTFSDVVHSTVSSFKVGGWFP